MNLKHKKSKANPYSFIFQYY